MLRRRQRPALSRQRALASAFKLESRLMLAADAGQAAVAASDSGAVVAVEVGLPASEVDTATRSLVLIDGSLDDVTILASGISPDADVVLLDPARPLLDQVTQQVVARSGIEEIHLVTHGEEGKLLLGDQVIDVATLQSHRDQLQKWQGHLTASADLLVYGCKTGAGNSGAQFARTFAQLTGADIASSSNRTGASELGGDWDFETVVGSIDASVAVLPAARTEYDQVLDITVTAAGSTGEEKFELLIDGEIVSSWTATTAVSQYTYQTEEAINADRVAVRFTNDLYKPQENIDRNLFVDNVSIDGLNFESEEAFSTGTYLVADGATPGYARGDTLHVNGLFQYGGNTAPGLIDALGGFWYGIDDTTAIGSIEGPSGGLLTLGPSAVNAGAWRYINTVEGDGIRPGEEFLISVGAILDNASENFEEELVFGVDFYDAEGTEIGDSIGFLDAIQLGEETQIFGFSPVETVGATAWVILQPGSAGASDRVTITNFSIEVVPSSTDSEAPVANLVTSSVTYRSQDPFASAPNFVIDLSDNSGADQIQTSLSTFTLVAADGTVLLAPIVFDGDREDPNTRFVVVEIPETENGYIAGDYEVFVNPGTIEDAAGNVTPATRLGSIVLNIDDSPLNPNDLTPPVVVLLTDVINSNSPSFSVRATDESAIQYGGAEKLRVTGPDGENLALDNVAGGGIGSSLFFTIFDLSQPDLTPGIYSVFVEEGFVYDINNNLSTAGLLGTFEYRVVAS